MPRYYGPKCPHPNPLDGECHCPDCDAELEETSTSYLVEPDGLKCPDCGWYTSTDADYS